jgi:hypothetical protein
MGDVFERLGEAVCGHVLRTDVLELQMTVAYPCQTTKRPTFLQLLHEG